MPAMDIVGAWKNEEYRDSLSAEQRAQLPEHPAGVIEFEQPQLEDETLFGPQAHKCKYLSVYTQNHGHCK